MYPALLVTHSIVRYLVLILLLMVIVNSYLGVSGKKPFGKTDNLLGLTLFSTAHTQLLLGIILYIISPMVRFGGDSMKDPLVRYWTSEHIFIMLIAITFITLARTTAKKMTDAVRQHKRMFVFNSIALLLILVGIAMAKRGFFSVTSISSL